MVLSHNQHQMSEVRRIMDSRISLRVVPKAVGKDLRNWGYDHSILMIRQVAIPKRKT